MTQKAIAILVCEPMAPEGLALLKSKEDFQVDIFLELTKDNLLQKIPHYDCLLVRSQTLIDRRVIEAGKKTQINWPRGRRDRQHRH